MTTLPAKLPYLWWIAGLKKSKFGRGRTFSNGQYKSQNAKQMMWWHHFNCCFLGLNSTESHPAYLYNNQLMILYNIISACIYIYIWYPLNFAHTFCFRICKYTISTRKKPWESLKISNQGALRRTLGPGPGFFSAKVLVCEGFPVMKRAKFLEVVQLPETNSLHLKIGRNPKGNDHIPTIHFQVRTVSFRGG